MKYIAVIAYSIKTAAFYAKQIHSLFGSLVQTSAYQLEGPMPEQIESDVVLISAPSIYGLVEARLHHCRHVIVADITLYKSAVDRLRSLPSGTRAMLVNTTMEMAVETIGLIRNSGVNHIELVPVYPGIGAVPPLKLAITPGEPALVPPGVEQIIDLKDRVLSTRTIINLAAKLELTASLQTPGIRKYFDSLAPGDAGVEKLMDQVHEQRRKLELVMEVFDGGIVTVTAGGIISFLNPGAESILDKTSFAVIGQPLDAVLPELKPFSIPRLSQPLRDQVVKIRNRLVDVSAYPLTGISNAGEFMLMLRTVEDVERNQYHIRRQVIAKGFTAKHTFDHIKTQNPQMLQLKETARRMAQSASSIVIYGPSGTGKELFAQSIHNASPRREYPFIAINCASIPENLLESELFGYSEGAFTGAKKGGKQGYFELAHKGTLFLDEIGEMDLVLQARILRVLQEKEVTRVGGDSVIGVDVRIISASNKRLLELVRQNRFRADLYYRLNVLSLEIPPLDQRCEDIPILIEDIRKELGADFFLEPKAMDFLQRYPWQGNVRELRNFVERLSYLGQKVISAEAAASQLDDVLEFSPPADGCGSLSKIFFLREREHFSEYAAILSLLSENQKQGRFQGRQSISRDLKALGVCMSEQQVRTALHRLQQYDLVKIMPGRHGTELTPDGKQILQELAAKLDE